MATLTYRGIAITTEGHVEHTFRPLPGGRRQDHVALRGKAEGADAEAVRDALAVPGEALTLTVGGRVVCSGVAEQVLRADAQPIAGGGLTVHFVADVLAEVGAPLDEAARPEVGQPLA